MEKIPELQRELFDLLDEAFRRGMVCLLRCWEKSTGQPAYLVCALVERDDGSRAYYPLARQLDRSPYDDYQPPIFDD